MGWSGKSPGDWRTSAACLGVDPNLFFPTGTTALAGEQAGVAKAVCATCPVSQECLDWAMANSLQHGVWGGMDEFERRQFRRAFGGVNGYRKRTRLQSGRASGAAAG